MKQKWEPKENLNNSLTPDLLEWFFNVKRLGKALQLIFPNIKLSKLSQFNGLMSLEEQYILNADSLKCHIRLISHHIGSRDIVLARTIIPEKTYVRYKSIFDNLKNQSIGESFLFQSQKMERSQFYVKQLFPDEVKDLFNLPRLDPNEKIWVRASLFNLEQGHSLLIKEFFLEPPKKLSD